jgi:membrane fusion protein, multidrug efflux system
MSDTINQNEPSEQELVSPEKKRLKRIIFLVLIPLLILIGIVGFYLHGGRYVETDNAYIKAHNVPIGPQVAGTIQQVFVQDYQQVKAGDVLFSLDPAPFQVAVAKAQANLNQVKSQLASSKASYSEKLAEISLAKTKKHFAQKDQKRQADLVAKKFISVEALDKADETNDVASQQIIVLQQDLTRIAESLGADINAPIDDYPIYQAALAELDQAKLNLSYTEVKAPKNGTVSNTPSKGQYLSTGDAALSLIISDDLWIEANFTETDLTYVHPGQKVTIHVDMYPNTTWYGHVQSMSPATGSEFALLPAQNATGNWVKVVQRVPVRITVDSKDEQNKLRVGLSTEVNIDTGHKRQLLGFSF